MTDATDTTKTTPARKRPSRAAAAAAKLAAAPQPTPEPQTDHVVTSHGRSATGDNGGGRKPKAAKPSETPKPKAQPKAKKPVLGQSGYRAKYGVSDAEILKGIRAELGDDVKGMSDEQILAVIGWALTVKSGVAKVRASKSA